MEQLISRNANSANWLTIPAERARVPNEFRFHDLRHSYAAMLTAQGDHPRADHGTHGPQHDHGDVRQLRALFSQFDEALDEALDGTYRDTTGADTVAAHT